VTGRFARLLSVAALAASASFGYYHFLHFTTLGGQFQAIPEKFDLTVLPNSTLTYHVSENGPTNYAATDGFPFVVSQIRAAARVWNGVETSALRLKFGGVVAQGATQNAATPSIDVIFEDLPPGVNGYGGPTVRNDVVTNASGSLVPIQRSVVVLARDIANRPTWSEQYFLTAVHEFGHALGLQHSFVSGAMATEITRATTKVRPILPDDVAGLSLLYPSRTFREGLGAISGRVASSADESIGLASVVAVSPGGVAIGTMTNPDGTYRIDALPPGLYYLYAHPIPPAFSGEVTPGNVVLPVDGSGNPLPGGQQFDTVFFPASRQPFATVEVSANGTREGVNFSVNRRTASPSIHSVTTYSYPGQRAVKPAHIYTSGARNLVVITGTGLIQNAQPASGLQISSIGGSVSVAPGGIQPYASLPEYYLQAEFQFGLFASEGPVHLIFSRNNEIYVLPYGLRIADRAAPQLDSAATLENGDILLAGKGIGSSTRIEFDGTLGTYRSFDALSGRLTVTPPPATPGTAMHLTAYGSDGQSSLFLQSPLTHTFTGSSGSELAAASGLASTSLPAGSVSMIEINGSQFAEGLTSIGFGSPDIDVKQVWFPSPTRMLANVQVAPNAAPGSYNLTLLNGLRLSGQPGVLQVTANRTGWVSLPGSNGSGLVSGTLATVQLHNLPVSGSLPIQITINERPAAVLGVDGSIVSFTVPAGLTPGVSVLKVQSGGETALPLAVPVTLPQATIGSVLAGFGTNVTQDRPARYGELINLMVVGLPEGLAPIGTQPRISMTIGGVEHRPLTVNAGGEFLQLQFTVQTVVPPGTHPVVLTIEGHTVAAYSLPVRAF